MNVLVIGSGGREHALSWALARSPQSARLFALPGNPGMAALGTVLPGDPGDVSAVLAAAREHAIDLVVIGPEGPLVAGLADGLRAAGVRVFGPSALAAQIEGSKVFAKELMRDRGIPSAGFAVAHTAEEAREIASRVPYPQVIKADGLAAGKGALIVRDQEEAHAAITDLMVVRRFGSAGERVVFEEFLEGEELSVFALACGESYRLLPPCQDYKRAHDDDRGPNTGGMGSISPVGCWTAALEERVRREVIEPVLDALARGGREYRGLLYAGLMVRDGHPRVIEFNCRFGDPETQALVPILRGDLLDALWAASDPQARAPRLPEIGHDGRAGACVVIAAEGYPDPPRKGDEIAGLAEAAALPETHVFHAGTARVGDRWVTAGGRVLNVVGEGPTLRAALDRAYAGAARIEFAGAFYRRDIGWRGVAAAARGQAPGA